MSLNITSYKRIEDEPIIQKFKSTDLSSDAIHKNSNWQKTIALS